MNISRVQPWGNSQGIRIPKKILDAADIRTGSEVSVTLENSRIVIEGIKRKKNIRELFEGYDGDTTTKETDWGSPVGKEIW